MHGNPDCHQPWRSDRNGDCHRRSPQAAGPQSRQPGAAARPAGDGQRLDRVDPADLVWSTTAGSFTTAPDHRSVTYTAPSVDGSAILTVVSSREAEVTAAVSIAVVSGSITLAPLTGQVYRGEKLPVRATVTGLTDTTLDWTTTSGSVAGTGLLVDFTPPQADGPVTATAASPTNPAVKGSATFQVVRRGSLAPTSGPRKAGPSPQGPCPFHGLRAA